MLAIDIDLNQLSLMIKPYFNSTILKRGWDYYRQAAVRGLQADDNGTLTAKVLGSEIYKVTISLSKFPASRCNCPYGGYCKHIAAVLFEACKGTGNDPKQLLDLVTEPQFKTYTSTAASAASQFQAKRIPVPKPQDNGIPDEWHLYFENQFKHYSIQAYHTDSMVNEVHRKLVHHGEHWQPIMRAMYGLHIELFMMKLAGELYRKLLDMYYYYQDYSSVFLRLSESIIERASSLIDEINELQGKEKYPLHLAQTADYLAKHTFSEPEKSCMRWLDMYRLIWGKLLDGEESIVQERNKLLSLIGQKDMHEGIRDKLAWAYAHFDIIEDRDSSAMLWIERNVKVVDPGETSKYLQAFVELQQGERLVSWLRWLKPYIRKSRYNYVQMYLSMWRQACAIHDAEEEWKETAVAFLPESFYPYAEYLFDNRSYREWIDLCMLMNLSPLDLDSYYFKVIGAEDPRLALPLYHHAAQRYIQEKNRDSYKRAVKMLKKLNTSYKKLKEQTRFAAYIQNLSKQYLRYRAFQEELRKGKLIE